MISLNYNVTSTFAKIWRVEFWWSIEKVQDASCQIKSFRLVCGYEYWYFIQSCRQLKIFFEYCTKKVWKNFRQFWCNFSLIFFFQNRVEFLDWKCSESFVFHWVIGRGRVLRWMLRMVERCQIRVSVALSETFELRISIIDVTTFNIFLKTLKA